MGSMSAENELRARAQIELIKTLLIAEGLRLSSAEPMDCGTTMAFIIHDDIGANCRVGAVWRMLALCGWMSTFAGPVPQGDESFYLLRVTTNGAERNDILSGLAVSEGGTR